MCCKYEYFHLLPEILPKITVNLLLSTPIASEKARNQCQDHIRDLIQKEENFSKKFELSAEYDFDTSECLPKLSHNILIEYPFRSVKAVKICKTSPDIQFHSQCCRIASEHGNLEVLKYFHEIGLKSTSWCCAYASKNGHLRVLKYLHESGCPWDEQSCILANNQPEIVEYLRKNKCPGHTLFENEIAYPEIQRYLKRHQSISD